MRMSGSIRRKEDKPRRAVVCRQSPGLATLQVEQPRRVRMFTTPDPAFFFQPAKLKSFTRFSIALRPGMGFPRISFRWNKNPAGQQ